MSKILFFLCALIFSAWVINFDADAYSEAKSGNQTEQEAENQLLKEDEKTEKSEKLPEVKKLPVSKTETLPVPKSDKKAVKKRSTTLLKKSELLFPLADKNFSDVISDYGDARGGGKRIHEGIDVPAERGTPVLAVADGTVAKVGNKGNAGKQVWLEVGNYQFFYAHLDSYTVSEGDEVKKGDILGTVGNTGNARHTLPHLHFGVYVGRYKTVNPVGVFE